MKIIEVIWRDSNIYTPQETKDSVFEVAIIKSVGYLVQDNKKDLVISGDLIDGDIRRTIVIPKENIIKRKFLK